MAKFKVGDKVEVVGAIPRADYWTDEMEKMVGTVGEIVRVSETGTCVISDLDFKMHPHDLKLLSTPNKSAPKPINEAYLTNESVPEPVDQEYLTKLSTECTVLMDKNADLERCREDLRAIIKELAKEKSELQEALESSICENEQFKEGGWQDVKKLKKKNKRLKRQFMCAKAELSGVVAEYEGFRAGVKCALQNVCIHLEDRED